MKTLRERVMSGASASQRLRFALFEKFNHFKIDGVFADHYERHVDSLVESILKEIENDLETKKDMSSVPQESSGQASAS